MESMETDEDYVGTIQETTRKICFLSTPESDTQVLLDHLDDVVEILLCQELHQEAKEMLSKCGIELWNTAVGKSAGKSYLAICARMRHCALSLVHVVGLEELEGPLVLKMAISTARAWIDLGKYEKGEKALEIANEMLEREMLQPEASKEICGSRFPVCLHLAQCAFKQGKTEMAKNYVQKAAAQAETTEQKGHVVLSCYNFGVECCNSGDRIDSSFWLEESYELGRQCSSATPSQQAKTLRFWATNLMKIGGNENLEKAVKIVDKGNKEDLCANGLLLKIRVLLSSSSVDKASLATATEQLAETSDLTMNTVLSAVSLLQLKKMFNICCNLLDKLQNRFQNPSDKIRLCARQAEVLLEMEKFNEAEHLIKNLIGGGNLEDSVANEVKGLCWNTGRILMKDDAGAALQWLEIALPLFKGNADKDFHSEFLRLKAVCLIENGCLERALETAKKAETLTDEDPRVLLLLFKLTLITDDQEQAKVYCQKMLDRSSYGGTEDNENLNYICAAAKVALEINQDMAIGCLEQYLAHVQDPVASVTILKCLVRLHISDTIKDNGSCLLQYLKSAFDVLKNSRDEEAQWFMKVAWNLALLCAEEPGLTNEFYGLCLQFTKLGDGGRPSLIQQKRCLLLAVAAGLDAAKCENVEFTKRQILSSCLEHIPNCRKVCQELSVHDTTQDISTPVLLMLYEFEVCLAMNDPRVEHVLESAIALPQTEPKTFEILADLVIEYRPSMSALAARSLKISIKKQLQQSAVDFNKCSKTFHSLIELAFKDQTSYEQAWGYYMDVLEVLDNTCQDNYPELETLWLLSKAWNCGIQQYREMKYSNVLDWLGVALRLVEHLTTFKKDYDQKLKNLYKQVKSKIENRNCELENSSNMNIDIM